MSARGAGTLKSAVTEAGGLKPIGPYSPAQVVHLAGGERLVFASGAVAIDPASGELKGADTGAQTEQTLANLAAILQGAGVGLGDVVKTTVYLADMKDFQEMNQVYARFFPDSPPARTTIAAAGLPRGARVEIDAVAVGRDH
ncbi:MAG TPA: Rid family detoxifying hydrolase [Candidatus Eisenbacteria bacterium]|jgi:2-iminobutanoate/2-iminopropanoate deaminase